MPDVRLSISFAFAALACAPPTHREVQAGPALARLRLPTSAERLATFSGSEGTRLGISVLALPDLDGDRRAELAAGALPGATDAGRTQAELVLFGSREYAALWRLPSPGGRVPGRFAERSTVVTDVDGDGQADLAVSDWSAEHGRGAVEIRGSKDGRRLMRIEGMAPFERGLGAGLAAAGDIDGDGAGDLAVALVDGRGRFVSGRNGAVLGEFHGAPLGLTGDLDGDGRRDLLVFDGVPRDGALRWPETSLGARVLSTPSGAALLELVPAEEVLALEAHGPAGDLDGDGFLDWTAAYRPAGGDENDFVPGARERLLISISGRSGRQLSVARLRLGDRGRMHLVTAAGDVDGDGARDVLAAWHLEVGEQLGFAEIVRGRDGVTLHQLSSANWSFATSACVVPDWNGDGRNELALGEPLSCEEGREAGRVHVIAFPARP